VRDLQPGDEVTCDYGNLNILSQLSCRCQSADCREKVNREDAATLWQQWDKKVAEALKLASAVPQPLLKYSLYPTQFEEYVSGNKSFPSHGEYYGNL
jgi:hypothetical protein